ncbi:MBL fold metallo-hydrolase [Halomonas sp. DP8Y7-1]|uniref:MBL fold metallo-hydrolase n=1 Tax=Halomonas sp. DP8Y7-1 TaxID=2859078 RepID=UPI001C937765|nr:MBL fold metallo-hydrolase [Halomonas sp. DP8Y7-1]MBY6030268.1 MBL fold metallo-hydrolase [Halomonas sp. DP8Y7-1]
MKHLSNPTRRNVARQAITLGLGLPVALISLSAVADVADIEAPDTLAQAIAERGLAAGQAFPGLASLCDLSTRLKVAGQRPKGSGAEHEHRESHRENRRGPAEPMPTRVFDNLYYVGTPGVASWAVTTSEGIILIDALNNNEEAERFIERGLVDLGLDPGDITTLIVTHAHGDHYGGQQYLVDAYGAQVVMSDADWTALEQPELAIDNPRWGEPPVRDVTVADGEAITLGDTSIDAYVTPGHTPGTLSLVIPLKDGESTHHAVLWGGTGFNFGPDEARLREYSASAARMKAIAAEHDVDVFLSNHPTRDNSLQRIEALKQREEGAPHPFVSDQSLGALDLLMSCSLAQAERVYAGEHPAE